MNRKTFISLVTYGYSGSFTIEAAVIYPLTILLIFSFIFLSFFIHDKIIAHSGLMTGIYSGSISLSAPPNTNHISDYVSYVSDNHSIMKYTFSFKSSDIQGLSYETDCIHSNTFIPYIDTFSKASASLGGGNICRRVNLYHSLYLLSKGDN
ncbi:MAG: hypothetical protein E7266_08565 [Lachnospiraceae bacterium]|nr:hypothetical protein [Lachnospiraceae bacterium]